MRRFLLFSLLGVVALVTPIYADVTVKMFTESKKAGGPDWSLTQTFLIGAGAGFLAANLEIESSLHRQPLYCQPRELGLGVDNYVDIIERQIKRWIGGLPGETPITVVLLSGLQKTFPCKP